MVLTFFVSNQQARFGLVKCDSLSLDPSLDYILPISEHYSDMMTMLLIEAIISS